MKKILVLAVVAAVALSGSTAAAQGAQPKAGDRLFDFTLPVPGDRADRNYLGLSGWGKTFKIADIQANLVLIEILSMYCPFCQKDAPIVNQLYDAIEKDSAARGKIKIIGIGAGNSAYETEVFRKRYSIPFPIFPDPDYDIHKKCGEVRTPFFIAVRLNPDGTQTVTYARLGSFGEVPAFLQTLKKSAGL
ncbi:MAG TPA: TlpA disulfide reductase family protein [Syntrophales bacterium]|nr:TlpA disulfide reductase family protein [Syntrophales bacterium]